MDINDIYMLAIETSSRLGSVAVGRGTELLAQAEFTAGARHGVELVPALDRLVRGLNLTRDRFGIVAVSSGPGSFTGLRVGFTFARCLAQITGANLMAVPSTEVIVENLRPLLVREPGPLWIAPILDAKRKQVYTAGFKWHAGQLEKVLPETALPPADLLASLGRPLWVTGEGIDYHRESFADQSGVILMERDYWLGQARHVLTLGRELARQDQFIPYNRFTPTYVRLPEAEERWQLKHASPS